MTYLDTFAEVKRSCNFIASDEDDRSNFIDGLQRLEKVMGEVKILVRETGDFFIHTNEKGTLYVVNDATVKSIYSLIQ